jgi:hypothetical protein
MRSDIMTSIHLPKASRLFAGNRLPTFGLLTLLPLVCATAAAAQVPECPGDSTVVACVRARIAKVPELRDEARRALVTQVSTTLEELATGPNVSGNTAGSAIFDFIPRFAGALVTEDVTGGLPVVDLRFNAPVGSGERGVRFTLQGGATLHQATVFTPLADSVAAHPGAELGAQLKDGDDASVFLAANVEGQHVGRALAPHASVVRGFEMEHMEKRTPKADSLLLARFDSIGRELTPQALDPSKRLLPECAPQFTTFKRDSLQVGCLLPAVRSLIESDLNRALPAPTTTAEEDSALAVFARLVNNQPQVNTYVEYRTREDVVGPKEWGARGRIEFGLTSVNTLRDWAARNDTTCRGGITMTCLQTYMRRPRVRHALARSLRMWVAGEVVRRVGYELEVSNGAVHVDLEPSTYFSVAGGIGSYLGEITRSEDRLDIQARYAVPHNDPLRYRRAIVSAFYTLELNGETAGVIGVTWANPSEFRNHRERRLHVDLGLTYKFNPNESDEDDESEM